MNDDLFSNLDNPDRQKEDSPALDPRLLEKALKRMRALVDGNGVDPAKVAFAEENKVRTYKFPARVQIKLVPRTGTRIEPGKNTRAELVGTSEEYNQKVHGAVVDVVTQPEKRQIVLNHVLSRSDKGFGMKSQSFKFRELTSDIVRHESCQACSRSGSTACRACQGKGMVTCAQCRGSHQMACPKCGGAARITTAQGSAACDYCRASGRVPCTMCRGMGIMKCRTCGASGKIPCDKCSGTGWLSYLTHIEIEGQVHFSFDGEDLPQQLAALLVNKGSFLVSKGDVEVHKSENNEKKEQDADDIVEIKYDVSCPYGSVHFQVGKRVVPAMLLGWQARLIEAPAFIEHLTKTGMQAIKAAAEGQGNIVSLLHKAARFAVWQSVLSQLLETSNFKKVTATTLNRYPTGLDGRHLRSMVVYADRAVRLVTRRARYIGLSVAMVLYSGLAYSYFFGGLRSALLDKVSLGGVTAVDFGLLPAGMFLGVFLSRLLASHSQRRAFAGIVDAQILKKLPRSGHIMMWSIGLSVLIYCGVLALGVFQKNPYLPSWLGSITG